MKNEMNAQIKEIVNNLLVQSKLLLEKSILLSEDAKTLAGNDTRILMSNVGSIEEKEKLIEQILKESEQIRKNSSQVLANLIQILDISEQ